MMDEDDLVRRIRAAVAGDGDGVLVGIGDDCAVLEPTPGTRLLAKTDLLIEDVHFRRRYATPHDVGWKSLAVNVSDISSKGARSRWALVALACPASTPPQDIDDFYAGLLALARAHDIAVVGGDTSSSPGAWFVNVMLLGEASRPVLRSTARAGDVVAVTATLGRSAAGLALLEGTDPPSAVEPQVAAELMAAHLRPQPRVAEGRWLGAVAGVTAMMDISDGIGIDLPRLCAESGVGATVNVEAIPIAPGTRAVARAVGLDPLAWATGGGEDYELLVVCAAGAFPSLSRELADATGTGLTRVGVIDKERGVRFVDTAGRPTAVQAGYQHFAGRR
jgi:thiamine-monophosphate kinase